MLGRPSASPAGLLNPNKLTFQWVTWITIRVNVFYPNLPGVTLGRPLASPAGLLNPNTLTFQWVAWISIRANSIFPEFSFFVFFPYFSGLVFLDTHQPPPLPPLPIRGYRLQLNTAHPTTRSTPHRILDRKSKHEMKKSTGKKLK